jgi:hypothetical protein
MQGGFQMKVGIRSVKYGHPCDLFVILRGV